MPYRDKFEDFIDEELFKELYSRAFQFHCDGGCDPLEAHEEAALDAAEEYSDYMSGSPLSREYSAVQEEVEALLLELAEEFGPVGEGNA